MTDADRRMKVVWGNPILWGYKHGHTVAEIAAGLMIPEARVRGEIIAYEQAIVSSEITLKRNIDALSRNNHIKRLSYWQRQRLGARAALETIEAGAAPKPRAVRYGR